MSYDETRDHDRASSANRASNSAAVTPNRDGETAGERATASAVSAGDLRNSTANVAPHDDNGYPTTTLLRTQIATPFRVRQDESSLLPSSRAWSFAC